RRRIVLGAQRAAVARGDHGDRALEQHGGAGGRGEGGGERRRRQARIDVEAIGEPLRLAAVRGEDHVGPEAVLRGEGREAPCVDDAAIEPAVRVAVVRAVVSAGAVSAVAVGAVVRVAAQPVDAGAGTGILGRQARTDDQRIGAADGGEVHGGGPADGALDPVPDGLGPLAQHLVQHRLGAMQRTMPAPARAAPETASTAAPGKGSLPAARATTPRLYLVASRPGPGQTARTSASSSRSTAAGPSRCGARPRSTRWSAPARSAPPGSSSPAFTAPKVTVARAVRASGAACPAVAATKLGR